MAKGILKIKVLGDASGLDKTLGGVTGNLGKLATVAAGAFAGAKMVSFFKDAVSGASDLEESASKVGVVFGDQARAVKDFASTAATSMGMSEATALEAAGTFGNLMVSLGMTGQEAAGMSTDMVQLAADLGSFNNVPTEEALDAIRSGLVGETEPLKRFGVNMNEATLKAKAMELGLYDGKGALDANAKAQAAYALILDQTKTAQGDFARTSDGMANSQKIISAGFEDMKADVGTALMPVIMQFINMIKDNMPTIVSIFQSVGKVIGAIAPIIGILLPPLGELLGLIAKLASYLIDKVAVAITWLIEDAWPSIRDFFTVKLPKAISEGIDKLYEWIVQPFVDLWTDDLEPWFTETWEAIKTFFTETLPENIKEGIDKLYEWIVQPFVDLWNDHLGPWFSGTWGKIRTFFTETLPSNISAGLSQLWDWMTSPFIAAWTDHLKPWFDDTWVKIKNLFTRIPTYVSDGLATLWEKFTGPFRTAWNWINEHIVKPAKAFFNWLAGKQSNTTFGESGGHVNPSGRGGGVGTFAHGGLIPGSGPIPITAHGGEYVLTKGDTDLMKRLVAAVERGGTGGPNIFQISGNDGVAIGKEIVAALGGM